MIQKSQIVICYVETSKSGVYTAMKYAQNQVGTVINIILPIQNDIYQKSACMICYVHKITGGSYRSEVLTAYRGESFL